MFFYSNFNFFWLFFEIKRIKVEIDFGNFEIDFEIVSKLNGFITFILEVIKNQSEAQDIDNLIVSDTF